MENINPKNQYFKNGKKIIIKLLEKFPSVNSDLTKSLFAGSLKMRTFPH